MGRGFYTSFTSQNTYTKLNELAVAIETLPILTLYVPVVLPPEEVKKLAEWTRQNVGRDTIIDLLVVANLSVGCAFVWKGVYHDFSIRYFMHQHRDEFVKHIRTYATQQ